jgi:hypothetical protein
MQLLAVFKDRMEATSGARVSSPQVVAQEPLKNTRVAEMFWQLPSGTRTDRCVLSLTQNDFRGGATARATAVECAANAHSDTHWFSRRLLKTFFVSKILRRGTLSQSALFMLKVCDHWHSQKRFGLAATRHAMPCCFNSWSEICIVCSHKLLRNSRCLNRREESRSLQGLKNSRAYLH